MNGSTAKLCNSFAEYTGKHKRQLKRKYNRLRRAQRQNAKRFMRMTIEDIEHELGDTQ